MIIIHEPGIPILKLFFVQFGYVFSTKYRYKMV